MNWPLGRRVLRAGTTRCRILLSLVATGAVLMASIGGDQPAYADTTGVTNPGCSFLNTSSFNPGCLPPDLLTFSGLYAATADQVDSLQDLETQAVTNTIQDHGLASTDANAVLSWGRARRPGRAVLADRAGHHHLLLVPLHGPAERGRLGAGGRAARGRTGGPGCRARVRQVGRPRPGHLRVGHCHQCHRERPPVVPLRHA